jgi:methyltransferase (TIGR00027 family)
MALFRAIESAGPRERRLFEDRQATRFLSPGLRAAAHAARVPGLRLAIERYIDRRWPGPRLSGVVRTRVIDDFVLAAVADGCTQLVLLGAGYDTRATRFDSVASVAVYEVDHPATQARKRARISPPPPHVRYVPVDFEHDSLPNALTAAGFDPGQRTCLLWEGVFSYLTPEAIDATLAAIAALCGPGSRVLITYVDEQALTGTGAWLTAVRDAGEPFQTGLDPARASEFFFARALKLSGDESTREAAMRFGVAGAENIPGFYRLATLET